MKSLPSAPGKGGNEFLFGIQQLTPVPSVVAVADDFCGHGFSVLRFEDASVKEERMDPQETTSLAKMAANRSNALRSTGPTVI
jgi:hypothetical protein